MPQRLVLVCIVVIIKCTFYQQLCRKSALWTIWEASLHPRRPAAIGTSKRPVQSDGIYVGRAVALAAKKMHTPCLALRHDTVHANEDVLAPVLRQSVTELQLQHLEAIVRQVEASQEVQLKSQHRVFGENREHASGHEVTFLHLHASPAVKSMLWDLVVAADTMMQAGVTKKLGKPANLRCLEAISYSAEINQEMGTPGVTVGEDALSWHDDGFTLYTMVVALSTAGIDFEGGEFEVRAPGGRSQRVTDLKRGDVIVWRGWDYHRVCSVSHGQRNVVVAEWWLGGECSSSSVRPSDTIDVAARVVELGAACETAHFVVAGDLKERGDLAGAERNYVAALRIDPEFAGTHYNLGLLRKERGCLAGAEQCLKESIRLAPTHVPAHKSLGGILRETGDLKGAEACFRAAVQLAPQDAALHKSLGTILEEQNQFEDAEISYRAARELEWLQDW